MRAARNPRNKEAGFMMAMLLVFMVILGLLLMKAQPYAKADVTRDREAELIFRGEALARAIKLFQLRTGRFPYNLEELMSVRPRILRKVYRDPMTQDGEWRKIFAVQPGPSGDTTGLPIIGVASKNDGNSYKVYRGKTLYSDWIFSAMDSTATLTGATVGVPGTPQLQPAGGGPRIRGTSGTGGGR